MGIAATRPPPKPSVREPSYSSRQRWIEAKKIATQEQRKPNPRKAERKRWAAVVAAKAAARKKACEGDLTAPWMCWTNRELILRNNIPQHMDG